MSSSSSQVNEGVSASGSASGFPQSLAPNYDSPPVEWGQSCVHYIKFLTRRKDANDKTFLPKAYSERVRIYYCCLLLNLIAHDHHFVPD